MCERERDTANSVLQLGAEWFSVAVCCSMVWWRTHFHESLRNSGTLRYVCERETRAIVCCSGVHSGAVL